MFWTLAGFAHVWYSSPVFFVFFKSCVPNTLDRYFCLQVLVLCLTCSCWLSCLCQNGYDMWSTILLLRATYLYKTCKFTKKKKKSEIWCCHCYACEYRAWFVRLIGRHRRKRDMVTATSRVHVPSSPDDKNVSGFCSWRACTDRRRHATDLLRGYGRIFEVLNIV